MTTQPIDLNNIAVLHLQRGDLSRAVEILIMAIEQIQCQMQWPQKATTAEDEKESVVVRQVHAGSFSLSQEADGASSMHCRALLIANEPNDLQSEGYYRRISAVILYNLAFINHSRGLQAGLTSDLAKALKLYEMSIALVQEQADRSDLQYMAMAILRNMGQIHSCLFHLQEAKACFDSLRDILSNVGDAHIHVPEGDYESFFISAMFQGNELLLAPAA